MRIQRSKPLFDEVLTSIEGATVDHWQHPSDPELINPRVTFPDGISFDLMVVNTSPPSGDNHRTDEVIVTKDALAKR